MYFKRSALVAALASTAAAQMGSNMTLTAVLASEPELSNLTTYVSLFPQIVQQLSSAQNITILAPSNEAFAELLGSPAGAALAANDTALLQAVLTYHVLTGAYPSSAIPETAAFIPTLLDNQTYENVTGGQVVQVQKVEDSVEITSGLKQVSTVTKADLNFTGGVIHVIDKVLTIPANLTATLVAANLTSLAGALGAANLTEETLMPMGITVFAPSNEAFQRIGSALPNLSSEQIVDILTYHVVPDTVAYSSSLMNDMTVGTASEDELTIRIIEDEVFVNSAQVVVADVLFAGGVAHVIDNVLNPNATDARPDPAQETQSAAFEGASSVSDAPFTSGVPTPTGGFAGADSATTATSSAGPTTTNAAPAMRTGAVGAAALFGAGAAILLV